MKKLGFGTMRLPVLDPKDPTSIDYEQVKRMADLFLQKGFTYVDTAWMYHNGMSENAVKVAFSDRYPRESFFLADKMPVAMMKAKEEYPVYFQTQLERCGVDYFDNYLIHNIFQEDIDFVERTDCFGFLRQMKEEGKIRHIGFSFHDGPELLERLLSDHPEVEFVQIQLNYIDWDNGAIQSRANYEVCRKHGVGVVVMEPVKGGSLVRLPREVEDLYRSIHPDMSMASWAVRFAASQEGVDMVLSGMSEMAHMEDNLSYMEDFRPLDAREAEAIRQSIGIINDRILIPCTGCHYCVNHGDGCPMNISIPEYFAICNDLKAFGGGWAGKAMYRNLRSAGNGQPADCIGCGQCEYHCPQHIPIIDWLRKIQGIEAWRTKGQFTL